MNIGNNSCCLFHPTQQLIGVCPFCLNERLLILASSTRRRHGFIHCFSRNKLPFKKLPKIFALGSLLNRLDFKHCKTQNSDDPDVSVSTSQEDSFISIKFEENGVASREKGNVKSKVSNEPCTKAWNHTLTKEAPKEPNKSDRACNSARLAEVAKADWSLVPTHQVEDLNSVRK